MQGGTSPRALAFLWGGQIHSRFLRFRRNAYMSFQTHNPHSRLKPVILDSNLSFRTHNRHSGLTPVIPDSHLSFRT